MKKEKYNLFLYGKTMHKKVIYYNLKNVHLCLKNKSEREVGHTIFNENPESLYVKINSKNVIRNLKILLFIVSLCFKLL